MSAETKQSGTDTHYHLERAEKNLEAAKKSAGGTKDPALIQKVTKIHEEVVKTKTDLGSKIEAHPEKG